MNQAPDVAPADWLQPQWPAPARVHALCTTRAGGVSSGPYASLNLGSHVGDVPQAVHVNRQRLQAVVQGATAGARAVFLNQVHGTAVAAIDHATPDGTEADACVATEVGAVCTIMVADCLPVLLAHGSGAMVAAAHAGWRGLAAGVLEATLARVCRLAGAAPDEIECWLGPCIGPTHFEVGPEVVAAFLGTAAAERSAFHQPSPGGQGRSMLDLAALGRERLRRAGVMALGGNDSSLSWCTRNDPARYFSYRHSACTGRMAALVWLGPAITPQSGG